MSGRIVEGLWDCPYCGAKKIGGLTKHCPSCGHPQDKGTKFYLGESKKYLDEELAQEYGQGADWACDYCGSLNRHHYKFCSNCGSSREDAKDDYFTSKEEHEDAGTQFVAENFTPVTRTGGGFKRFLPIVVFLLAFAFLFRGCFSDKTAEGFVSAKNWTYSTIVEEEQTLLEKDWSIPAGGRLVSQSEQIHHYDQILDHYETRERQRCEQVFDHYDSQVSYSDNGDGTFSEHITQTPVYRTEYYTEYYQEPIYLPVPVYATEYTYEIERWVEVRTETTRGTTEEPYWPTVRYSERQRNGRQEEEYEITITVPGKKKDKTYTTRVSGSDFAGLKINDKVEVVLHGDTLAEITKK